jgi:hypothetical protein
MAVFVVQTTMRLPEFQDSEDVAPAVSTAERLNMAGRDYSIEEALSVEEERGARNARRRHGLHSRPQANARGSAGKQANHALAFGARAMVVRP